MSRKEHLPPHKRAKIVDGRVFGGKISEMKPGQAKSLSLDRFSIALFRVGDEFFAIKDACPHADYPLSKGVLEPHFIIKCAAHGWRFDIRNGHGINPSHNRRDAATTLNLRTFPVELDHDQDHIWICLNYDRREPLKSCPNDVGTM